MCKTWLKVFIKIFQTLIILLDLFITNYSQSCRQKFKTNIFHIFRSIDIQSIGQYHNLSSFEHAIDFQYYTIEQIYNIRQNHIHILIED